MKKIISKILIILIIFITMFECMYPSIVNAANDLEETLNATTNLLGGIVSIIYWIPRLQMTGGAFILNKIMDGVASSERKN